MYDARGKMLTSRSTARMDVPMMSSRISLRNT